MRKREPGEPPSRRTELVSPVIDCEPPPLTSPTKTTAPCPSPNPAALHRRAPRPLRPIPHATAGEATPPHAAIAFADSALRRVLEVIDRRRPIAQLRPLLAPPLIDDVIAMAQSPRSAGQIRPVGTAATLRGLRLRMVDGDGDDQAEVFGTYRRGQRVLAIAARIAFDGEHWRIVALQLG